VRFSLRLMRLPVRLHRFDAQIKGMRRLAGAHALADHVQNLQLAIAQPVDGVGRDIGAAGRKLLIMLLPTASDT